MRLPVLCLIALVRASAAIDADGDGIDDNKEMSCAKKFQPVVYLAQKEDFGPLMVGQYLSTCVLRKYGKCGNFAKNSIQSTQGLNQTSGLCSWETAVATRYASCFWRDPDHTVGAVTSATLSSTSSAQCGGKDGCYIRCLHCAEEGKCENLGESQPSSKGTHGAALTWTPFYVHVFPETGGTIQIQYWFFYAFNGPTLGFGLHQGDWEHFAVRVDSTCTQRIGYVPFAHGRPPPFSNKTGPGGIEEENGHMVVYSAINSHATYLSVGEHNGGTKITKDYTSKGDRWFPAFLINAGEKTNSRPGYRPMSTNTSWVDFTDVWGSDSAFDGSLDNGLCDSGPHLQWDQGM